MNNFCRILIVEDEFVIRQGLKYSVDWESEGFQVVGESSNGLEALKKIEELKPQIVLTDVVMPVMDGMEFTRILQEKYPSIQIVVISGYSDFEYVKSTFQHGAGDYILKPTLNPAELLATLKRTAAKIPGFSLTRRTDLSLETLLSQYLVGYGADGAVQELQRLFPKKDSFLLGMDVPYVFGSETEVQRQASALSAGAQAWLPGVTAGQAVIGNSVLLLVVNYDGEPYAVLAQRAQRMAETLPGVFYVCGRPFSGMEKLRDAYHHGLLPYLRRRFYHSGESLLRADQFEDYRRQADFDGKRFGELLHGFQFQEALQSLESWVTDSLENRSLAEFDLKSITQNALYQLLSFWEDTGLDRESIGHLKRNCFIRVSGAKSAEDFAAALHLMLEDFEVILKKYQISPEKQKMQEILQYVSQHFAEPLTLNELAKKFNFSYSYLSSYFSAHNREGFSEYLNRERIKRAEELLRSGGAPVSEVCGLVGYTDHSYFTKVFKKFTGSTPSEVRRESGRQ